MPRSFEKPFESFWHKTNDNPSALRGHLVAASGS